VLAAAGAGKPLLGICVGLQLLFDESEEMGQHTGLGILPGRVVRFPAGLTVPHMGWNQIEPVREHPLLEAISPGDFAYFAHSYYAVPASPTDVIARTDYGSHLPRWLAGLTSAPFSSPGKEPAGRAGDFAEFVKFAERL